MGRGILGQDKLLKSARGCESEWRWHAACAAWDHLGLDGVEQRLHAAFFPKRQHAMYKRVQCHTECPHIRLVRVKGTACTHVG